LKFKSSQAICHRLNAGRKGREVLPAFLRPAVLSHNRNLPAVLL
jgi:hypothetical protein